PYSDDPYEFVAKALSPAKVKEVRIHEDTGVAEVIVPDYQLSLAIGKEGQNARLAARLTGWRVDIKSESQLAEEEAYAQQEWAEGEWVVDPETGEQVWQPAEGGPALSAEDWEAAVAEGVQPEAAVAAEGDAGAEGDAEAVAPEAESTEVEAEPEAGAPEEGAPEEGAPEERAPEGDGDAVADTAAAGADGSDDEGRGHRRAEPHLHRVPPAAAAVGAGPVRAWARRKPGRGPYTAWSRSVALSRHTRRLSGVGRPSQGVHPSVPGRRWGPGQALTRRHPVDRCSTATVVCARLEGCDPHAGVRGTRPRDDEGLVRDNFGSEDPGPRARQRARDDEQGNPRARTEAGDRGQDALLGHRGGAG